MKTTRHKEIQELLSSINALPEKKREAVLWILDNYDALVSYCKALKLTEKERSWMIKQATQKDDMKLLALALLEQLVNS